MKYPLLISFLLLILLPLTLGAATESFQVITIDASPSKAKAHTLVEAAAQKLGFPSERTTKQKVSALPGYGGMVIDISRPAGENYHITAYLGTAKPEAKVVLRYVKRHFPKATLHQIQIDPDKLDYSFSYLQLRYILLLGASKSYSELPEKAREIAIELHKKEFNLPFDTREMIFHKEKGLIFPEDHKNEMLQGIYLPRRDNGICRPKKHCITIENSGAYMNLTPGLFILVAGIFPDMKTAKSLLEYSQQVVKDAYVKPVIINMRSMF